MKSNEAQPCALQQIQIRPSTSKVAALCSVMMPEKGGKMGVENACSQ